MADVLLFGISTSLSTWLPRRILTDNSSSGGPWTFHTSSSSPRRTIAIALGLGFGLVSLSIVESIPLEYMLVIRGNTNHQEDTTTSTAELPLLSPTTITIETAYQLLLWSLCIWITLLIPLQIAMGSTLESNKRNNIVYPRTTTRIGISSNNNNPYNTSSSSHDLENPHKEKTRYEDNKDHHDHHPHPPESPRDSQHSKKKQRVFLFPGWIRRGIWIILNLVYKLCLAPLLQFLHTKVGSVVIPCVVCQLGENLIVRPLSSFLTLWTFITTKYNNHPHDYYSNRLVVLGSIVGIGMTWSILHMIGLLVIDIVDVPTQDNNNTNNKNEANLLLSNLVSWLCAVGILLSSTLNGFGSVSMPHSCLAGLYLEPIPLETIEIAEQELQQMKQTLEQKRAAVTQQTYHHSTLNGGMAPLVSSSSSSFFTSPKAFYNRKRRPSTTATTIGFGDFDTVNHHNERKKQQDMLCQEVEFLETLCDELTEEIQEMHHAQETATKARTPMGRMKGWLGVLFSIILVVRLASAVSDIYKTYYSSPSSNGGSDDVSSPTTIIQRRTDPITSALLWLMGHHLVSHEDYNTLSQCISLLMTALLSFSQLRMFLRTVAALNRRFAQAFQVCTKRRKNTHHLPTLAAAVSPSSSTTSLKAPESTASSPPSNTSNSNNNNVSRVYSHMLGSLMGCYFLSCVVLTKRLLPPEYRSGFSAALGGTEYSVHSAVVNTTFCISAMLSASILGLLFGIQQQNTRRHASAATDLMIKSDTAAVSSPLGNLDAC